MPSLNDQQLISDFLNGKEESFELLVKKYLKPIYTFVFRLTQNTEDAQDITQEVFLKIWKNIKKFKKGANFKTWIFTIAKNTSFSFLKKRSFKSSSGSINKKEISFSQFENEKGENFFLETFPDKSPLPEDVFEKKNLSEKLNLILEKLPLEYRLILFLRYNDHFTFKEISQILEKPLNTVKSRHQRAIKILKKFNPEDLLK